MKTFFKSTAGIILSIVVIVGLAFGVGYLHASYTKTVGVAQTNADRQAFKASKTYNEGMAQDLSKCMLQYQQAKDVTAKKAIVNYVVHNFSDFDESKLQNAQVKDFLIKCMNGELSK